MTGNNGTPDHIPASVGIHCHASLYRLQRGMNMKIGCFDILYPDTTVNVNGYRGIVMGHSRHSNGVIVHKIRLTHKHTKNAGKWRMVEIEEKTIEPNYSFVSTIESQ